MDSSASGSDAKQCNLVQQRTKNIFKW